MAGMMLHQDASRHEWVAGAPLAVAAEQPGSAFVAVPGMDLAEGLCHQEERQVGNDNTVVFGRFRLQIPPSPLRAHYVRATVKVRRYGDGSNAVFHGPRCIGALRPDVRSLATRHSTGGVTIERVVPLDALFVPRVSPADKPGTERTVGVLHNPVTSPCYLHRDNDRRRLCPASAFRPTGAEDRNHCELPLCRAINRRIRRPARRAGAHPPHSDSRARDRSGRFPLPVALSPHARQRLETELPPLRAGHTPSSATSPPRGSLIWSQSRCRGKC